MKPRTIAVVCLGTLLALAAATQEQAAAAEEKPVTGPGGIQLLWQIGASDNDTRDFALAPDGHARFAEDPVYVVGMSDAKKDWPYAHPGPADNWAGSRPHTFVIAFGLAAAPKQGECRLMVDLVDTQGQTPPRIQVSVNGHASAFDMPRGGGDDSIRGDPSKGKEHRFNVAVPAAQLKAGLNEIALTTLSGSWVLYDWIGFETPAGLELKPPTGTIVREVRTDPVLVEKDGRLQQTVRLSVLHMGPEADAEVRVGAAAPVTMHLKAGANTLEAATAAVEAPTPVTVTVAVGGQTLVRQEVTLMPVRKWVVYMLPHSHVDIGYTHVQTDVEKAHWQYYEQAIEACRRTADYPPGAAFKWNAEVLWATDSYLRQASPEKREAFIDAVRKGWIGLDALYGNELTGLCRPEELVRLVDMAGRLKQQYGVPIESAMISDVPGYTWGIVPVLAGAGVKYFSIGPNGGDRIGHTLTAWGDKPFWWVSPSGKERVLVWMPRTGYWQGFRGGDSLLGLLQGMADRGYPYDLVQLRHCLGDNAGPGVDLSEFAKEWNAKYAYPKVVIATTALMMRDLEKRYGDTLPVVRGDFTPYWEDGAGSSARETALNRDAAERLSQAEALFAMLQPSKYPDEAFFQAWRNVVLYDEHTWGAHCSITEPDSAFTKSQWAIKQKFALDADTQSRELLAAALPGRDAAAGAKAVDVFNTCAWTRTDLVVLPKDMATAGDVVKDTGGRAVPSQRLSTGELAFLAGDVPALAAKRFTIEAGPAPAQGPARADGATLTNGRLMLKLDSKTGAITSLRGGDAGTDELVDAGSGVALNSYFYVLGDKRQDAQPAGPARIAVKEKGPLVASLVVESDAPGCNKLTREVRIVAGLNRVDLVNVLDKRAVREKEGVHLGFAFNVKDGVMRMDTPFAVVRPEEDQIPGACKNWFTVQRWVDVSNAGLGVTWATLDAPLVEVGGITAYLIGGLAGSPLWLEHIEPSQTLYSWVMNNHWHTNYRADQDGPTTFRYSLWPHGGFDQGAAQRFGIERSQPLVAAPAAAGPPPTAPRFQVEPAGVLVTAFKPSRDGKAWIVRLFNGSGQPQAAALKWADPAPGVVRLKGFEGDAGEKVSGPIAMEPYEIVTLRAALP